MGAAHRTKRRVLPIVPNAKVSDTRPNSQPGGQQAMPIAQLPVTKE